jgi:hypothetical protein
LNDAAQMLEQSGIQIRILWPKRQNQKGEFMCKVNGIEVTQATHQQCPYCNEILPYAEMEQTKIGVWGPFLDSVWTCKSEECIAQALADRESARQWKR